MEAKTGNTTRKGFFTGAGAGLVLFALVGALPGSFIGGVIGINIAGAIFGLPLASSLLSRIIVAASMLTGVLLSGAVFVVGSALAGWLIGYVIDAVKESNTMTIGHAHTVKIK